MDALPTFTDEDVAFFEELLESDPHSEQVKAWLNEGLRLQGQQSDAYHEAYPVAPLMEASEAQMYGGPTGVPMPAPPQATIQQPYISQQAVQQPTIYQPSLYQPIVQQPAVQQPIIHQPSVNQPSVNQPSVNQPIVHQPIVHQPIVHQPIVQQPAVQQTGQRDRSCPIQLCNFLTGNTRLDHLWDHLAEKHGYERAANEYTTVPGHLWRKTVAALKMLFVRDIRKLAWNQARMRAVEEAIRQRANYYVSCHGFELVMQHSITRANASKKKGLITLLIRLRDDLNRKGNLYNQTGQAQGNWDEVYENLVVTFQLDGNTQTAVGWQAEQYFSNSRNSMGDDMNQVVPPARVMLTDELVVKPGASLPPK